MDFSLSKKHAFLESQSTLAVMLALELRRVFPLRVKLWRELIPVTLHNR